MNDVWGVLTQSDNSLHYNFIASSLDTLHTCTRSPMYCVCKASYNPFSYFTVFQHANEMLLHYYL